MHNKNERISVIKGFLNDAVTSDIIYDQLLKTYLKTKSNDVHVLAASKLAIDLLNDAWRELERFKDTNSNENKPIQMGL